MNLDKTIDYLWVAEAAYNRDRLVTSAEWARDAARSKNPQLRGVGGRYMKAGHEALAAGDIQQAVDLFRLSVRYLSVDFRREALGPEEAIEVVLPGRDGALILRHEARPVDVEVWVQTLMRALLVDDVDGVNATLGFSSFKDRGLGIDMPQVEVYKHLVTQDSQLGTSLRVGMESTDPDGSIHELQEIKLLQLVPRYRLVAAMISGDQARFEDAVVQAHDAHVRWYSVVFDSGTARAGSPGVLIDWVASALVRLAVKAGFDEPPKSPYHWDFTEYP